MVVDKRNFWQKRRNWQRGLIIGLVFLVLGALYFALDTWNRYPEEFISEYVFLLRVLLEDYWRLIVSFILLPACAGYALDLKKLGEK